MRGDVTKRRESGSSDRLRLWSAVNTEGEDSATTISTELDTPYIKSVNTDPNSRRTFFYVNKQRDT